MFVMKIVFVVLLSVPIVYISMVLISKLLDEGLKNNK